MINMLPTLWGKVNSQTILSNILYHFHNKYCVKLSNVDNFFYLFLNYIYYTDVFWILLGNHSTSKSK